MTAIVHPKERISATYVTAPPVGAIPRLALEINAAFAAKFRDPFRSSVHYHPYPTGVAWSYVGSFQKPFPNSGPGQLKTFFIPPIALNILSPNYPYAPHGPTLYPGTSPSTREGAYWVQDGDSLKVSWNGFPTLITNTTVRWYIWNFTESMFSQIGESNALGGDNTFTYTYIKGASSYTLGSGGYITFEFLVSPAATPTTVTYNISLDHVATGAADIFAHRATADLGKVLPTVGDMRYIASSVMFTDTTPIQIRGGQIAAKQMPKTIPWVDVAFGGTPYSQIASYVDSWSDDVLDGCYAFLKPTETPDLDFFNQTHDITATVNNGGYWFLDTDSEYLVVGASLSSASFTGTPAASSYWTFVDGVEFVCNDQWRDCQTPKCTSADWQVAMEIVGRTPQFHRNFLHISELFSSIRAAVKAVAMAISTYGPGISELAGNFAALL
jgi:hypothetical protein